MISVDDSGDEHRTLFSALAIPAVHWAKCLDTWLGWRKKTLLRSYGLSTSYELHGVQWLNKRPTRGEPPLGDGLRHLADEDGEVLLDRLGNPVTVLSEHRYARRERARQFERALTIISGFPGAFLTTVHWDGSTVKSQLYGELLADLEKRLAIEQTEGLVFLDGLDPGPHFRRRHRELPGKNRRILEDPIRMGSDESQLIQMADFCVHAAFRHIRNSPADGSRDGFLRLSRIATEIRDVRRKT